MNTWLVQPSHLGFALSVQSAIKAGNMQVREALRTNLDVPRLPWKRRMKRRAKCCSVKALWAYNETSISSSCALTVHEMLSRLPACHLYGPFGKSRRSAVIGNTSDRLSSFIVYLENKNAPEFVQTFPTSVFTKRLILCVWDDYLYADGHCIVIWPPSQQTARKKRWAVRDPWRVKGTAVSINRRQLKFVIAGCRWLIM